MAFKASNYLPIPFICLALQAVPANAANLDADVNEALLKKDWPLVVLVLQPKKGQNFEHDLTLAKALLSLERRQEALKLLSGLSETHKDERVTKLLQSAATLFFAQETSNLYYEALEMIADQRFAEAKDRLDLAIAKEPGHILLLNRLIQLQLLLGQNDAAAANLKQVQASGLGYPEWKGFAAKLEIDKKVTVDEDEFDLYRELHPSRSQLLENEVTATFWIEAVKRDEDGDEMTVLALKMLNEHPLWTYALMSMVKSELLSNASKTKLITQIQKNLKAREAFQAALDTEMRRGQNLWIGYVNYDTLQAQLAAAVVAQSPSASPSISPVPSVSAKR